jgi:threonine/homoserine/homoserine lactone efflux protein
MKETNSPPEFSVTLRILGGGYLVYLAWGLRTSVQDGPLFLIAVIVFALVGLILAGTSIRYLLQHKYFRNKDINVEDFDEFDDEYEEREGRSDE